MNQETYTERRITDDLSVIDFVSKGRHGNILKRIVFTATESEDVYNLAFGDIKEDGEINDLAISNNGDRNKVLATIVDVVKNYTQKYPSRLILFRGSTNERTRLYRIAVGLNFEELSTEFEIYAFVGDEIVLFTQNLALTAFLIKRKNV
jgi:hypothetical protein